MIKQTLSAFALAAVTACSPVQASDQPYMPEAFQGMSEHQILQECMYRGVLLETTYRMIQMGWPLESEPQEYVAEHQQIPTDWVDRSSQDLYVRTQFQRAHFGRNDVMAYYLHTQGNEFAYACAKNPQIFLDDMMIEGPIVNFDVAPTDYREWNNGVRAWNGADNR